MSLPPFPDALASLKTRGHIVKHLGAYTLAFDKDFVEVMGTSMVIQWLV